MITERDLLSMIATMNWLGLARKLVGFTVYITIKYHVFWLSRRVNDASCTCHVPIKTQATILFNHRSMRYAQQYRHFSDFENCRRAPRKPSLFSDTNTCARCSSPLKIERAGPDAKVPGSFYLSVSTHWPIELTEALTAYCVVLQ